jgi:hypothetical protein
MGDVMSRPDFGKHRVVHQGVELECAYIAPGLTMQDLTRIFNEAHDRPENSDFAGNPALWPKFAGIHAVAEAILDAIFPPSPRGKAG